VKRMIIQYTVKPDRADENRRYIEGVFAALRAASPDGIRYGAFKQADGLKFVHLVSIETETGDNPLVNMPAFQAFQAEVRDRCAEQPSAIDLEEVGSYRVFSA
jgi:hypothetical protein